MMRDTTCRSALIAVCLLLVCAALGSAQSRKRGQQEPRGLTGIPNTPSASPSERRVALVIGNAAYQYTAPLTESYSTTPRTWPECSKTCSSR